MPRADSLSAKIRETFPIEVELIRSGGGVFEVSLGRHLIFSKKATGRFPEEEEVLQSLRGLIRA